MVGARTLDALNRNVASRNYRDINLREFQDLGGSSKIAMFQGVAAKGVLTNTRILVAHQLTALSLSHTNILARSVGISGLFGQNECIPSIRKSLLFYRWAPRA